MVRPSQLEARLRAILDEKQDRRLPRRILTVTAALATMLIVVPLAAVRAQTDSEAAIPATVEEAIAKANAQSDPKILDKAAERAEWAGRYDDAKKLIEAGLALRAKRSGEQSADYGIGLIQLADLQREKHEAGDGATTYKRALELTGETRETAIAILHLGTIGVPNKNTQAVDFARAAALNNDLTGQATVWMAIAAERNGNTEKAEQLFKQALAIEGANSAEAAAAMQLYANFLAAHSRGEEATSYRAQAETIWKSLPSTQPVRTTGEGEPFRIGGDVSAPSLVSKVEPVYSADARLAKYQGTAVITVEIGTDGIAKSLSVVRGLGFGLDQRAEAAISQWRFKPATRNGQPVPVLATIEVNFRLL